MLRPFDALRRLALPATLLAVAACNRPMSTVAQGDGDCPARASLSRSAAQGSDSGPGDGRSALADACGQDSDAFYFARADATLGPRGRRKAQALADCLGRAPLASAALMIVGHADPGGARGEDHELALRRANAVRDELGTLGVDTRRLHTDARTHTADCGAPEVSERRVTVEVRR